jgi:hypothetical protein
MWWWHWKKKEKKDGKCRKLGRFPDFSYEKGLVENEV